MNLSYMLFSDKELLPTNYEYLSVCLRFKMMMMIIIIMMTRIVVVVNSSYSKVRPFDVFSLFF